MEAAGVRSSLRPSEGVAGVVVSHLLVAVRFPPDFERAVAPRAQGADPRTAHPSGIPLQYVVR